MNQITKKQHWVPEFYLKKFTNEEGKLRAFDIVNKKLTTKFYTPSEVCRDDFFYAAETGKFDDVSQIYEEAFTKMEDEWAPIYDDLCDEFVSGNPSEAELYLLSRYISAFWLRSLHFREMLHDSQDDLEEQLKQKFGINKNTEDSNNILHLEMIKEIEGFGNLLFHKKWRIHYIPKSSNQLFVTSDTPVLEFHPKRTGFYGFTFLERTHYFVLNSKILIEFINPEFPGKRLKRKMLIDSKEVSKYNLLRLDLSHKFAYSSSKENFKFAEYHAEAMKTIANTRIGLR